MMQLIIQLVAGALGGTAAGSVMKNLSLGAAGNAIVGLVGGGLGGKLLAILGGAGMADAAGAASGMDIGAIVSSLVSGGVGGGVLMAAVGILKNRMTK